MELDLFTTHAGAGHEPEPIGTRHPGGHQLSARNGYSFETVRARLGGPSKVLESWPLAWKPEMPSTELTKPAAASTESAFDNASAKVRMILYFQEEVNEGRAGWRVNRAGETELHLVTGEAFLLKKEALVRLK